MIASNPTRECVQQSRVLVVGDAMLDRYWFGAVDRISPEAPVPVVRVNREEERLGGAANVALNVKTLGAQATLLTVVGDDEPARKLRQLLEQQGVTALLGSDPKLYTIVKLRVIGRSQQLIRIDFENQPEHEVLAGMLADYERVLPAHSAVLFSDYGKGGLTHIPRMIELARSAGKAVLIDPKGSDYSRYAGATVVTPNRAELAQVIGEWRSEAELHERAQALRNAHRLDAIQWEPGTQNGRPVTVSFTVPISVNINGKRPDQPPGGDRPEQVAHRVGVHDRRVRHRHERPGDRVPRPEDVEPLPAGRGPDEHPATDQRQLQYVPWTKCAASTNRT